ncbi:MAG: MBL fold metallo-hydrolase [Eubacteriales bacterium]
MIIRTLSENTSLSEDFRCEHGLSLYIETNNHKLLFDTGASSLFMENAGKMNVNIADVDLTVISHGHYDHGGGLKAFLSINKKALIYINQSAFEKHYSNKPDSEKKYIGLDEKLLPNHRFTFVGSHFVVDGEIELFSQVNGQKFKPSGNQDLYMTSGQTFIQDDFSHEQNLIIKEKGNTVLVAGCAHTGIVNILEHFYANKGYLPSHVIGGFHLYNRSAGKDEDPEVVKGIGTYLKNTGAKFYTCHCTGIKSYDNLKSIMGQRVDYLSIGSQVII